MDLAVATLDLKKAGAIIANMIESYLAVAPRRKARKQLIVLNPKIADHLLPRFSAWRQPQGDWPSIREAGGKPDATGTRPASLRERATMDSASEGALTHRHVDQANAG